MCVSMCVYVCVSSTSSGPLMMCVSHVCVLYAQHNVVVGAGAGVLSQQSSCLQQGSLSSHSHVSRPPRLAVVGGQSDSHGAGAMPDQLLWPCRVSHHVTSIERVDGYGRVEGSSIPREDGCPAAEQNFPPQVNHGHVSAVDLPHDGCQVLEV